MGTNNNFIFNRIFTKNTFNEWVKNEGDSHFNEVVRNIIKNSNIMYKDVISELYNIMLKSYRNEYVYKNTLLNKLLLGRHSINSTTALTEIPIEKSKADFILINGKAVVYEIKTELDNFDRLEGQLRNYYKAFDNVCVITSDSNYKSVLSLLEHTDVGVCSLTQRNTISTKKEPISNKSCLKHISLFKILRKHECENILLKYYGELPKVSQVKYYKECLSLFSDIQIEEAYNFMLDELKKRSKVNKIKFETIVPYELKSLIYFSDYNLKDYAELDKFLNKEFRG